MKNSTAQSSGRQSEKRNRAFVMIRRGLLPHLAEMSGNAAKLYLVLQLTATWQEGPKRGSVGASFDDMARWCGWSTKTLQRTLEELEAKPYVEVERATNQYELTRIKLLKYDPQKVSSAMDKSDQSRDVGADRAVDIAVDKCGHSAVYSKTANSQSQQSLQIPKQVIEVKKEKNGQVDAVRRPVDAELRTINRSSFSPSEKRKKLDARLARRLIEGGNTLDRKFDDDEREAFAFIGYNPEYPSSLPGGFVYVVCEVYDKYKHHAVLRGNLCSKIIDRCKAEQESRKKLGGIGADPSEYYWPPDFQDYRDQLRARERACEMSQRTRAELRA